jgi:3',5'-cyclic-AMP phosphodiesterase
MRLLDADFCLMDGIRIAGIGGVIGNPGKPGRRSEAEFLKDYKKLFLAKPDILVLHESPAIPEKGCPGSAVARGASDASPVPLTVCGHIQWPVSFMDLPDGRQFLNADARAILLKRRN